MDRHIKLNKGERKKGLREFKRCPGSQEKTRLCQKPAASQIEENAENRRKKPSRRGFFFFGGGSNKVGQSLLPGARKRGRK